MELFKVEASLLKDFNGNTTSVAPLVSLRSSGSGGGAMPGKAAAQTPPMVPLSLAAQALEEVEKVFCKGSPRSHSGRERRV